TQAADRGPDLFGVPVRFDPTLIGPGGSGDVCSSSEPAAAYADRAAGFELPHSFRCPIPACQRFPGISRSGLRRCGRPACARFSASRGKAELVLVRPRTIPSLCGFQHILPHRKSILVTCFSVALGDSIFFMAAIATYAAGEKIVLVIGSTLVPLVLYGLYQLAIGDFGPLFGIMSGTSLT